jgi:23S rRNA pseudouridine1911/1915/1917 synthase
VTLVWHIVQNDIGEIITNLNRSKRDRKLFTVASSGKEAITQYKVEKRFKFLTLLRVVLKTGRTHQIRIHLNFIHHPVFGDPQYYGRLKQLKQLDRQQDKTFAHYLLKKIDHQALHAAELGFEHPITKDKMVFQADLPKDFVAVLQELKKPDN